MLLAYLGVDAKKLTIDCIDKLEAEVVKVFYMYPPLLIDGVKDMLDTLEERNITMNICCNSSFIRGEELQQNFIQRGVSRFFSFTLYSDQWGICKPNPLFFAKVKTGVLDLTKEHQNSIIHIGDNPMTDGASGRYNFPSLIVNHASSEYKISDVVNLINVPENEGVNQLLTA
jgi:FMN phosphatase YigB (HAD superfamily)